MLDLPYPGLRPFRPNETHIYFGREEQTDDLLERLAESRFLAVTGPSGCGKSSLVNTGLIPSLQLGMLTSEGERWQVARMQPRGQPMANLASALVESGVVQSVGGVGTGAPPDQSFLRWVQNTLERGPLGVQEILERHPLQGNAKLLLVVDQFEEIFRYRRLINRDEADAFIALLLRSACLKSYPVYVIITMRSDFLGDCTLFPGLPEAINAGQFLTPRLTREQISKAISEPARVYGGEVEPALVNRLLNALRPGEDQLPILQHALMRMWIISLERQMKDGVLDLQLGESPPVELTLDLYDRVGGLQNALSGHADEVFARLDDRGQKIARRLFCALTERAKGQRDIRRPVEVDEVAQIADVQWQEVAGVADGFRRPDRCFLVPSEEQIPLLVQETELDIGHESLIRQWQRLSDWVDEEFESAIIYRRLEERAKLWQENKADLLGDIELTQNLNWRNNWSPGAAWAARYGTDYTLAMRFLSRSEAEHEAHRRRLEQKRREEEERRRKEVIEEIEKIRQRQKSQLILGGWIVTIALLALVGIGWILAYKEGGRALLAHLYERAQSLSRESLDKSTMDHALLMAVVASRNALGAGQEAIGTRRLLLENLQAEPRFSRIFDKGREQGRIYAVAFSPDGQQFAIGGQEKGSKAGIISLQDIATGDELRRLPPGDKEAGHQDAVTSLLYLPDRTHLISGSWDGTIRWWDLATGDQVGEPMTAQCRVDSLTLHPISGGRQLLFSRGKVLDAKSECRSASTWYWELQDREIIRGPIRLNDVGTITSLAMVPGTDVLVLGTRTGEVVFWDTRQEKQLGRQKIGRKGISRLAVSGDGLLALADTDDDPDFKTGLTTQLWDICDLSNPRWIAGLTGHEDAVLAMDFSRGWLASGGRDAQVLLWDLRSLNPCTTRPADIAIPPPHLLPLRGHNEWVRSIAYGPDGQHLVSGDGGGRSILWSVGDRRSLYTLLQPHTEEVWSLSFTGNGGPLVAGDKNSLLSVWDSPDPEPAETHAPHRLIQKLKQHERPIVGIAYSPHTGILLSADSGRESSSILGWRIEQGKLVPASERGLKLEKRKISGIAVSPDGTTLAVSTLGGGLSLWQWKGSGWVESTLPDELPKVTGWGDNLAFSTQGDILAFAARRPADPAKPFGRKEHFVQLIDLPTNALGQRLGGSNGHTSKIFSVAVSGQRLASGGEDNLVILWKQDQSGQWIMEHTLEGHGNRVNSVAFSPDGTTLASGSRDRTVRLWDTASGAPTGTLEGHTDWVDRVTFSPDGKWLASSSDDRAVILWNVDFATYPKIACKVINRKLSREEWARYLGDSAFFLHQKPEYQEVCPD